MAEPALFHGQRATNIIYGFVMPINKNGAQKVGTQFTWTHEFTNSDPQYDHIDRTPQSKDVIVIFTNSMVKRHFLSKKATKPIYRAKVYVHKEDPTKFDRYQGTSSISQTDNLNYLALDVFGIRLQTKGRSFEEAGF
jgi:hypothetical protein